MSALIHNGVAQKSSVATDADARRYQFRSLVIVCLIFCGFGAVAVKMVSGWVLVAIVVLLLPRWMIYTHELFHLRGGTQIDFVTRMMPLPFTPGALGYAEFRQIHFHHHQHPATPEDPDAFHLLGGPWYALWGALTLPEQSIIRWASQNGWGSGLNFDFLCRASIFGACLGIGGVTFLWLWVPLRLVYALGDFSFFYLLHVRHGVPGTYSLQIFPVLRVLAELIYGRTLVRATMFHDRHHLYPQIRARSLPVLSE